MGWVSEAFLSGGCHEEGSVAAASSCDLGTEPKNRAWDGSLNSLDCLSELGNQSPWTGQTFPEGSNAYFLPLMSLGRWDSQSEASKPGISEVALPFCLSLLILL